MNEDEKLTDVDEITQLLIRLRPARSELDSRVVFYEAGFSACQSQGASRGRVKLAPLIAAGILVAVVTVPASYRIGQTAAIQVASENDATVAALGGEPDAIPTKEQPPNLDVQQHLEPRPRIDNPKRWPKSELFARWIAPFTGLAEPAELGTEAETTLAVFHSSLVSSANSGRDWISFPFSATLARHRDWDPATSANGSESTPPLAVSDLQQLAQSLETTR